MARTPKFLHSLIDCTERLLVLKPTFYISEYQYNGSESTRADGYICQYNVTTKPFNQVSMKTDLRGPWTYIL